MQHTGYEFLFGSIYLVIALLWHIWHVSLPLRGLHQSSIYPDRGEEWQEKTEFVILFQLIVVLSVGRAVANYIHRVFNVVCRCY